MKQKIFYWKSFGNNFTTGQTNIKSESKQYMMQYKCSLRLREKESGKLL